MMTHNHPVFPSTEAAATSNDGVLLALAVTSPDEDVRHAACGNPSLPFAAMELLCAGLPTQGASSTSSEMGLPWFGDLYALLNNPALPAKLISRIFDALPVFFVEATDLREGDALAAVWASFATRLLRHPNVPAAVLSHCIDDSYDFDAQVAAVTSAPYARWQNIYRRAAAGSLNISARQVKQLVVHGNMSKSMVEALFANPAVSEDQLFTLRESVWHTKLALLAAGFTGARRETCAQELIRRAVDAPPLRAAAKLTEDPDTLAILSRSRHWEVRLTVSANPHTPIRVIAMLRTDPEQFVRDQAAMVPNVADLDVITEYLLRNPATISG